MDLVKKKKIDIGHIMHQVLRTSVASWLPFPQLLVSFSFGFPPFSFGPGFRLGRYQKETREIGLRTVKGIIFEGAANVVHLFSLISCSPRYPKNASI